MKYTYLVYRDHLRTPEVCIFYMRVSTTQDFIIVCATKLNAFLHFRYTAIILGIFLFNNENTLIFKCKKSISLTKQEHIYI